VKRASHDVVGELRLAVLGDALFSEPVERVVDHIHECVPKTDALRFVPAKGIQDIGFRLAAKNQDHFEPRIRAFASDQDVKESAFALVNRASSSSLCHSGTGAE
jgi:hypothetical protein